MIKSPLRYPGGKSKAIPMMLGYLPSEFREYREPFIGGGSLALYLLQTMPNLPVWMNDLNPELALFWQSVHTQLDHLIAETWQIKNNYTDGKALFQHLVEVDLNTLTDLERATRFFVLNRITFSGTVESGGYSDQAFYRRFTPSSIARLKELDGLFDAVKITNLDYSEVISAPGKDVFIYLDPPYYNATKSKLYGKKGNLHTNFDHDRFAQLLKGCSHSWLITYDDSPEIRRNFKFAHLYSWELQYGMNNYKQLNAAKGKELLITNYPADRLSRPSGL
jgi:DNA adenine methylase